MPRGAVAPFDCGFRHVDHNLVYLRRSAVDDCSVR
jgi:hypothetical protein